MDYPISVRLSHTHALESVAVGDEIIIIDAFGNSNFKIGFIRSDKQDGISLDYSVVKIFADNGEPIPAGEGQIAVLAKEGNDLIVDIRRRQHPAESNNNEETLYLTEVEKSY